MCTSVISLILICFHFICSCPNIWGSLEPFWKLPSHTIVHITIKQFHASWYYQYQLITVNFVEIAKVVIVLLHIIKLKPFSDISFRIMQNNSKLLSQGKVFNRNNSKLKHVTWGGPTHIEHTEAMTSDLKTIKSHQCPTDPTYNLYSIKPKQTLYTIDHKVQRCSDGQ